MGELENCRFCNAVRFSPDSIARRQIVNWTGITSDIVKVLRNKQFEYDYKADCHLLIMSERADREQGESLIEGLPKSTLRDFSHKLTLVPAGHQFRGWQIPRVLTRVTYFYIDPDRLPSNPEMRFAETEFRPRLFFFDQDVWNTLEKLKAQAESPDRSPGYAEALSLVLAHELLRVNNGIAPRRQSARGGLAPWQKRRVAEYIEEHLVESVSLSALAEVASLSAFHFSRAFKQSFGLPPHRYLNSRRMEKAKLLLAGGDLSVTQIGIELGFAETSSFSTAFHKYTRTTPTDYRRNVQ